MYRKIGRFETNYQIDLFCAVCVFILLHFVLLEKITFRFIGPPHFVLPDLHGIPLSTFHRIYTEYGSPDVSSVAYLMKKEDIPVQLEELQAQLLRERKAHEKEIKRLEKELAVEKLYGLANKTMIDLAEKKYNIRIRKNSAAK